MPHVGTHRPCKKRKRLRHGAIQDPRTLTAAEHEQARPLPAARGETLARLIEHEQRAADRVADELGTPALRERAGKRFEDSPCEPREDAIRRAHDRVLFVDQERFACEPRCDAAGSRDESAHAEHGRGRRLRNVAST